MQFQEELTATDKREISQQIDMKCEIMRFSTGPKKEGSNADIKPVLLHAFKQYIDL